jgi:hypothetical protein
MTMFYVAVATTVISIGYSYHMAQQAKKAAERARREAELKADLAKGFQFTEEGAAKALPIAYGRNRLGGVRVHFKVADSYKYAAPATGGLAFESKKQADNSEAIIWKLVNSNSNWTGTWSIVQSTKQEFTANPGWIVTKEDLNTWKLPERAYEGDQLYYTPGSVDAVYCPFKYGNDTSTKPPASLETLGFLFPDHAGTELVMNQDLSGSKNEFYFVQQAICQGGLHEIYTIDVDSKPYSYSAYSYGLRIHAYKNGSVADPMMSINDSTRNNARFTKVAYATCAFKLNRDDPQYNGTPEVQFYVEGNSVYSVTKNGSTYALSSSKAYTNNSALVLLDYLINNEYGKGIEVQDIDLESFYKASQICDIVVKSNVTNKGALNLTKGGIKNIKLYESNITLDSASSSRDNIQKLLDTMALSALVWTEGKYRLNLPYAFVYNSGTTYKADDIVQITDNSGKNRLFRATQNTTNQNPLTNNVWVEDVIPDDVKTINDEYLLRDLELVVSWPNAATKLNFCTVRFSNEEKNFSEDTVCWPEKEPTDGSNVYETFLAEDNNVALETEVFEAGITTPYAALARAEQKVRGSRDIITYTFKATAGVFALEPGDLFGFESKIFNVPYTILKVDEVETEQGGVVKISASTFDARLLAWNVPDNFYSPLPDNFEGYAIKQAKDLRLTIGQTDSKTSNYLLTWSGANDNRVTRYIVKYTTDSINNITSASVWTDLVTTSSLSYELPALDGSFTFTVVSVTRDGKTAPFKNLSEGSQWPLLSYTVSSSFLDGFNAIQANLSNDASAILANSDGSIPAANYTGSGTEIQVFSGSTNLVYDGVGQVNGTWKVTAPLGNQKDITCGTFSAKSGDPTIAVVGSHSNITADTASITYVITGKTVSGASFTLLKTQSFNKVKTGIDANYVYLSTTSSTIFKDSPSATLAGVHSSTTVAGKKVIGNTVSNFGYLTVQSNLSASESSRSVNSVTISPANDAGVSQYTVRLYETAVSTLVLDTEVIPIIFKGNKGSSALSVVMSNNTHAIPCASDGTPIDYSNSGTALYVYEGGSRLVYDGTGTLNGTWKVVLSASNITAGSITDSGDFATIASSSAMTAETAAIVCTITGKTSEGVPFSLESTQTIIKARRGQTIIDGFLSNSNYVFVTDENGTVTGYTGTATEISVYEGNSKLTYDGVGTGNGKWKVIAYGTNITPAAVGTFSVVNSTDVFIPSASALTADSASITFTITGKSSTGTAFTVTKTQTFSKNKQGITGKKTASVQLYQWATAQPTAPSGTSTFTWSTLSNGSYTVGAGEAAGWSSNIPSNPGTPSIKLWTATIKIEASNAASTSNITWTGATVASVGQNGQAGVNVATATLYKWATTIPAAPSGTNTWTWTSNDFDAVSTTNTNNGWSKTPSSPTPGMTLWGAEVKLSDSAINATTSINWTTASIGAKAYAGTNGGKGDKGDVGQQGASYRLCFAKSTVATATAETKTTAGNSSFVADGSWGLTGSSWSGTAPALSAGEYLWQSDGVYDPATNITTWTTPYWSSLKVGSLSAISANMGTVTAGLLKNSTGTFQIDLDNGTITISV